MVTAKNDALNIELKMYMIEKKIKNSFERINIQHLTDEEESEEKEEKDNDIIKQ